PLEGLHDLLRLAPPHQAVIHEDAGKLVADGPVDEGCGNGRVNAAAEPQDGPAIADLPANLLNRLVHEVGRRPVGPAAADVYGKAPQNLKTLRRVRHLGMELHSVVAALRI